MTVLADQVDLVIGVDTHKHTNTAAVVLAATGGVLEDLAADHRNSPLSITEIPQGASGVEGLI